MTIASQTSRVRYSGDGATTVFPITYYFAANADIVVSVQIADGTIFTKALGTDYTLSGALSPSGGTCTFVAAPTSGFIVSIDRDPPVTQVTSYNNSDPFAAKSHEAALDKLTTIDQRTRGLVARALIVAVSDPSPPTPLPPVAQRALKYLGFDASGNPIAATPAGAGDVISSVMKPVVAGSTLAIARAAMGLNGYGLRDNSATNALDVNQAVTADTTNQTISAAYHQTYRYATGPITYTLPITSSLWSGFGFYLYTQSGNVTLTPNAADHFQGYANGASIVTSPRSLVYVTTNSSGLWTATPCSWSNARISITGPTTVSAVHNNQTLSLGGGSFFALTFPAGSTLDPNFMCVIVNNETTAIGKGIAGVNVGNFTLYPGESYLVYNDNNTLRLLGGSVRRYRWQSCSVYVDATFGSDSAIVADGLSTGARAYKTITAAVNAVYNNFDHIGGFPVITVAVGTYNEGYTIASGIVGANANLLFINGATPVTYTGTGYYSSGVLWQPGTPGAIVTVGDGGTVEISNIFFNGNFGVKGSKTGIQIHQTGIMDLNGGCGFGSFGVANQIGFDGAGGTFNINGGYNVAGDGSALAGTNHVSISGLCQLNHAGGVTVTIGTGANQPNFNGGSWFYTFAGFINLAPSITWTNLPTNTYRWTSAPGGIISFGGNAANVPGTAAGTPATGSNPLAATGWAVA